MLKRSARAWMLSPRRKACSKRLDGGRPRSSVLASAYRLPRSWQASPGCMSGGHRASQLSCMLKLLTSLYDCGKGAGCTPGAEAQETKTRRHSPNDSELETASGPSAVALFSCRPAIGRAVQRQTTGTPDGSGRTFAERHRRRQAHRQWRNY